MTTTPNKLQPEFATIKSMITVHTSPTAAGNMSPRIGDTTHHQENQDRWLRSLDIDPAQLCLMQCNHGNTITPVNWSNCVAGVRPEAEALITNTPGVVLGLLTADCIPAIFHDPIENVIALAHLNRKTIAFDLAQKTLERMVAEFDVVPTNVRVHFEPHIHAASYQFDVPLIEPTPPQLAPYLVENNGRVTVDFAAAHRDQLLAANIKPEHLTISPIDVGIDTTHFSHYGSRQNPNRPVGRHLTVVQLL